MSGEPRPLTLTLSDLQSRLPRRLARWGPQFLAAHLCYGVDALLLAAICDRESLGGEALKPLGPGGYGDGSHGRGLMQLDDRSHPNFLLCVFDDGVELWKDPAFNIMYAARLLARNIELLQGDVPAAVAAYNCGFIRARRALATLEPTATLAERLALLNKLTTGGNYVQDVFARRGNYLPIPPAAPKGPPK